MPRATSSSPPARSTFTILPVNSSAQSMFPSARRNCSSVPTEKPCSLQPAPRCIPSNCAEAPNLGDGRSSDWWFSLRVAHPFEFGSSSPELILTANHRRGYPIHYRRADNSAFRVSLFYFRLSVVAEGPAYAGAGAVVAPDEPWWRAIVPVAVERNIPGEIAPQFYVVRGVQAVVHTAGFGKGRKEIGTDRESGLVEPEKSRLSADQCGGHVLRGGRHHGLQIVDALPGNTAGHRDGGMIGVLQVPADPGAKSGLQLDALDRALQEVGKPSVVPIVPAEQALDVHSDLITRGGVGPGTGGQRGIDRGIGGPARARVVDLGDQTILRRLVAFVVHHPHANFTIEALPEIAGSFIHFDDLHLVDLHLGLRRSLEDLDFDGTVSRCFGSGEGSGINRAILSLDDEQLFAFHVVDLGRSDRLSAKKVVEG